MGTVWRQGWVFQNAKVPNANGPREQPHTSPTRHSHAHTHICGVTTAYYTTETYAGLDRATGRGKYGKHTGPGRSTGKKLTLPLSGASNHPSVTSRQRKRRITSHYIDTSGKDSTFTQERRALAGTKQGRHLYRRIWLVARAPSQYSNCDDCHTTEARASAKLQCSRKLP